MALSDKFAEKAYAASPPVGDEPDGGGAAQSPFKRRQGRALVAYTDELKRIEKLPRRDWEKAPDLLEAVVAANAGLKTPGGTMELRSVQVASLRDIYEVKGLLAAAGCGSGKTLVTILAATVLAAERPILFVPASLREKTFRAITTLRRHWKIHRNLMVLGYEEMGLAKNSVLLETLQPDLIIADECHMLRNLSAGRTRRFNRYFKSHPKTMFIGLSGTITKRSLRDYAHLLKWALKGDLSPIPKSFHEVQDWADAIDEKPQSNRVVSPGALLRLCREGENVRQGFRRRLVETPGVVATSENDLGVSLRILKRKIDPPAKILEMLAHMRRTWETPNGDEITDPMTLWAHARQLCTAFWYRWVPPPPKKWLEARKGWNRYVRETLHNNRRGLDTPLQVWRECQAWLDYENVLAQWAAQCARLTQTAPGGYLPPRPVKPPSEPLGVDVFKAWNAIKDSFEPKSVPQWESDFMVKDAALWLRDKEPGIVWTEHDAFAQALAKESGRPYYGAGEKASREILDATGPIIASIRAHGIGKDLERWSRALIVSPPPSGQIMEQVISRLHRPGQQADTVTFEMYLFAPEQDASFQKARNDAVYIEHTTGSRQRLNFADIAV